MENFKRVKVAQWEKIIEYEVECPECGKHTSGDEAVREVIVPKTLSSGACIHCGHKFLPVITEETEYYDQ